MRSIISNKQRWLSLGLYGGVWTMMGLVSASQANGIWLSEIAPPAPRSVLFVWQMVVWYGWGALTPLVLWLGRRFPLERAHWLRNSSVHVVAGFLCVAAHLAFFARTGQAVLPTEMGRVSFLAVYRVLILNYFHFELLIYWAVLGSGHAFDYYRRYREGELAAAQLEQQLVEAQLQALKMQLHPHFLFNTLNTIATLVRKQENDAAVRMLAGLSDLLRYALEQIDKQEVPLKQELDFIEQYLELEQARFRDRLTVRMQVAPETFDASVPNLILQPLVENAVRHGIAQRAAAGLIEISAWRAGGELFMQVRDDGPGLASESAVTDTPGVGLANIRARLQRLYGAHHQFALRNGDGVTATLVIPFRLASAPALHSEQLDGEAARLDRG